MPRPKRSKVAPSAPTKLPHQRVLQESTAVSAAQKQQDLFSPSSSGRNIGTSDDSDGLVVAKRGRPSQTKVMPQEYTMSGALGLEDIGDTRLKPPSAKTRAALFEITRRANGEQRSGGSRARGANVEKETDAPDEIPSSMPQESLLSSTQKPMFSPSQSSKHTSKHQSAQKKLGSRVQETPRFAPSVLGHSAFKKRPRQPSLLRMTESQNQTQLEVDDEDLYNFLPDDESTPLIKSLSRSHVQSKTPSSDPTSGSRKRKQKSPEVQVLASQSQSQSTLPRSSSSSSPPHLAEQEDELYGLPLEEEIDQSQPSLPRHRSTQTPQPEIFSDTLAPPQSSSPAEPKPRPKPKATNSKPTKLSRKPQTKSKPQQRKRKEASPAPPPLSPTSTQPSPMRPATKTKPLTTAHLQNLLPQRRPRGRPKGTYDMPSSSDVELDNTGLGEDEDELSFHATKVRGKKSGPKDAAKKNEILAKKGPKTYTRKSIVVSDDEDESSSDGEEGDRNMLEGRKKAGGLDPKAKAEMKRLADKFREVDEYTLDFEDMTGSSSQMKDAR
ncbi:hypothetical protein ACLMJK_004968 [Lecanora helva]